MSETSAGGLGALLRAARAFEDDVVIPHCVSCARPCCGLTDVVLELDFQQVKDLYKIERSKKELDRALPSSIRKQGERYYAHGEACPAYDLTTKKCRVYATKTKPQECSDFPLYGDGDVVTVDLRCEAVAAHVEALRARLRAAVPGVVEARDAEFPDTFLTFRPAPLTSTKSKAKKRSLR